MYNECNPPIHHQTAPHGTNASAFGPQTNNGEGKLQEIIIYVYYETRPHLYRNFFNTNNSFCITYLIYHKPLGLNLGLTFFNR